ncbi:hypothetical protein SeMB42_g00337 [Synchytrium endobioticum]|uniref:Uncharacterized protein n=1 Tax=Synchytrium endobioticum TaxID=286115 RepID=A0A507DTV1_9FUNG|nr:hypothetical protein SeMB42_g00337 [Synchytrium endobioticum]
MSIKRVGCLAVKTSPHFEPLMDLLSSVPPPSLPYSSNTAVAYLPTQVKTVATTAPLDKRKKFEKGEKKAMKRTGKMKKKEAAKVIKAAKKALIMKKLDMTKKKADKIGGEKVDVVVSGRATSEELNCILQMF